MSYNLDLEKAGVPAFDLGACRNADYESETLDFHHLDLRGSVVECYISEYPGAEIRLGTFVVSKHTEIKPYQAFIDECRFEEAWIPCGETPADSMTTSIVNLASAQSTFENLPRAKEQGQPVTLYYCLRRTSPNIETLLAGRFILTETA